MIYYYVRKDGLYLASDHTWQKDVWQAEAIGDRAFAEKEQHKYGGEVVTADTVDKPYQAF